MRSGRQVAGGRLPLGLSIVALVVAVLGSTPVGQAAKGLVLPANSVGAAQLKRGSVTAAKVRDGSLLARDFRRGQLPRGATGPAGPAGPQGPAGAKGDKGDKGDPAPALWASVSSSSLQRASGVTGIALTGAGTFRVSFDRDVSKCALLAAPTRDNVDFAAAVAPDSGHDVIVSSFYAGGIWGSFSVAAFC
jgi:hypothetical protein